MQYLVQHSYESKIYLLLRKMNVVIIKFLYQYYNSRKLNILFIIKRKYYLYLHLFDSTIVIY